MDIAFSVDASLRSIFEFYDALNRSFRLFESLSKVIVKNPADFTQRLWFRLEVLLRAANLRHGTHGFTSLPKEVMLRIFTLWKIHRPRPGLNPRTSGPVASMITTGPTGSPHTRYDFFTRITRPKTSSISLEEDMFLLTDANVCRELIIEEDICPAYMLGGISIYRYDRSLRFMVTCVAWFRKQATQTCFRQNLVPIGYDIKESAVFLSAWCILTLLPVFSNLLRVGKEIKESTDQCNLALFLLRKFAFKESFLPSQTVKALPLVLRGHYNIFTEWEHDFRAQGNIQRKISPSSLNIYIISLYGIWYTFLQLFRYFFWLATLHSIGRCINMQRVRPGAHQSSKAAFCKSAFAKSKLTFGKSFLLQADLLLDRASLLHRKQWSSQVQRAKYFLLKRAKTCSKAFLLFARLVCAMSYL